MTSGQIVLLLLLGALFVSIEAQSEAPIFKEVLKWGVDSQVITSAQEQQLLAHLDELLAATPTSARGHIEEAVSATQSMVSSAFSGLSLLRVLYFLGGCLVIGAMTLFVTLAFEKLGGLGMMCVGALYMAGFAGGGLHLWHDAETQLLGGVLCTVAVCMTPLTIYGFLLMMNLPAPGRNFRGLFHYISASYLPLEFGTLVAALLMLSRVRFPFLMAPVALSLFFISMDICDYCSVFEKDKAKFSAAWGIAMMLLARQVELALGASGDLDFGFWLYVFGLLTFCGAGAFISFNDHYYLFVFFSAHIVLLSLCQYLHRDMFAYFALLGLIVIPCSLYYSRIKSRLWLVISVLFAFLLLLQSYVAMSHSPDTVLHLYSRASFYGAMLVFVIVGMVLRHFVMSSELTYLLLLSFALSLIAIAKSFAAFGQIYYNLVLLVGCVACTGFHARLAVRLVESEQFLFDFGLVSFAYLSYRFVVSSLLLAAAFCLQEPALVSCATIGYLALAGLLGCRGWRWNANSTDQIFRWVIYALGLMLLMLAKFTDNLFVYYSGCALCIISLQQYFSELRGTTGVVGLVLALLSILLSVLFQSNLLLVHGAFYLLFFIGRLASEVFKNSLLFPFALSGIGLSVIYIGYLYQKVGGAAAVSAAVFAYLPAWFAALFEFSSKAIDLTSASSPHHLLFFTNWHPYLNGQLASHAKWLLAPAVTFHKVRQLDVSEGTLVVACFALLAFAVLYCIYAMWVEALLARAPTATQLTLQAVTLAQNPKNNGLSIKIRGRKPANLDASRLSLDVDDDAFWRQIQSMYPNVPISFARSALLPLTLNSNNFDGSELGVGVTDFNVTIELFTGRGGERAASHNTIKGFLSRVRYNPSVQFRYKTQWWAPAYPFGQILLNMGDIYTSMINVRQNSQEPGAPAAPTFADVSKPKKNKKSS
eukprot:TRINITY_DN6234_c0_g2_i1.p1 TRINITY_DN6234_c0_g2~~TRINITY_DN6234_c0_g2_i1.p1  ORF type:complete len:960 (-),score=290.92 TRINITY_DN6234_c0_g2_i1:150-2942(-)